MVLAAAMSLTPAQSGLNLTNSRVTLGGMFGPNRPDTRYLPGDLFFMVFDIEGLQADPQGRVDYSMGMVVTHSSGKEILNNKPEPTQALIPLGASRLPARVFLTIGFEMRGTYTCSVTVTDRKTNQTRKIDRNFEVLPLEFGIVAFRMSYDMEDNMPAPLQGVTGQVLVMQFQTVGFTRDPMTGQPNNQLEVRILDESGRPTTQQPQLYVIKQNVNEDSRNLAWHIPMPLTRDGTFTVELKATDMVAGKSYKLTFKVKVTKPDEKG
jgi:hypothetical protein